jgi:hypothetical protein
VCDAKFVDISGTKGVNPGKVKLMQFDQTVKPQQYSLV